MDFSLSEAAIKRRDMMRMAAGHLMRPIARQFDEAFGKLWIFRRQRRLDFARGNLAIEGAVELAVGQRRTNGGHLGIGR